MKQPFSNEIIQQAQIHSKEMYPDEACGFILEDKFLPLPNVAEHKDKEFQIQNKEFLKYNGRIKAVVHSHPDYPHISKADMESQIRSALPWGVVFLQNNAVQHTAFWGNDIIYDLIGRPFIHGLFDCYALVRDYWRLKGFDIKEFPRENLWWQDDPSMLEDGVESAGFHFIDESEVKVGDVVFMKVMADVVNHSGIVIEDGLVLHHLYNRLSRREPLFRWRKYITGFVRYKDA